MARHAAQESKTSPQAKMMDLFGRIMDIFTRRAISAPTAQMVLAVKDLETMALEYGEQCAVLAVELAANGGAIMIEKETADAAGPVPSGNRSARAGHCRWEC